MKGKSPLVSVIMPIYNGEDRMEESILSILNQTYKNIELIIINDGSTDSTNSISNRYAKKDKRVRVLSNSKNQGLPYTRNKGLINAKGCYIANLDADDIALDCRIERQVRYLEKNKKIALVYSNYSLIINGKIKKVNNNKYPEKDLTHTLMYSNIICNSTVMFRRSVIKDVRYDLEYKVAQDYKFFSELIKKNNFSYINEVLVHYRTGHNNITKRSMSNGKKIRKKLINNIQKDLLKRNSISLSNDEKVTYFNFFHNEPIYFSETNSIEKMLFKIYKQINDQNELEALYFSISKYLLIHNISLISKLSIIKKLKSTLDFMEVKSQLKGHIKLKIKNIILRKKVED